jgi:hypothetical protein
MTANATIPLSTLRWWRELVDANPTDLAPRIDAAIKRATGEDGKDQCRDCGGYIGAEPRDGRCACPTSL